MDKIKTPQFIFAFMYTCMLFYVTGYCLHKGLPETLKEGVTRDITIVLITTLVNNVKSMLHFFDGTSEGSKAKDETLKTANEQAITEIKKK